MNYAHAASNVKVNLSSWDAIWSASPIVQLTLLILVIMSVACWTVVFQKRKQFLQIKKTNNYFINDFLKVHSLDSIFEKLDDYPFSSTARVFKAGYLEMQRIADSNLAIPNENAAPLLTGIDNLERTLRKAIDREVEFMEGRLTLLATTGSTGPFIGLFGTVWGIMGAFQKIGQTGVASLAVVAPGISEALIATAIGLAAAIPAVVAYNYFVSLIRKEEMNLNNFSADYLNIVKRNFFKG